MVRVISHSLQQWSPIVVVGAIAAGTAVLSPFAIPSLDRAATWSAPPSDAPELISRRYPPSSASRGTGRREIMTQYSTDVWVA
jgi:hypothetical protein